MPNRNTNVHVIHNSEKGWDVKRSGSDRSSGKFLNKQEAINYGRRISQSSNTELFVHNRDGRIAWRDSYIYDPFPPSD